MSTRTRWEVEYLAIDETWQPAVHCWPMTGGPFRTERDAHAFARRVGLRHIYRLIKVTRQIVKPKRRAA